MLKEVTEFLDPGGCLRKKDDELTFASDLITWGGNLVHRKGDKASIRSFIITPGHWHSRIPDLWMPDQLLTIQMEDSDNKFVPTTFVEFKTT